MQRLRNLILALILTLMATTTLFANTDKVEEQRRIIAKLEASIAKEERELASLKKNKASKQKLVNSLIRQIEQRNALINATNRQLKELNREIATSSVRIDELSGQLSLLEKSCAEMARAAYRNHRFNNTLTYILSSTSTADFARRLASLRIATERRSEQMKQIVSMREDVRQERAELDKKRTEAAAAKKKLDREREKLRRDRNEAKLERDKMSKKEKNVLQSKIEQQEKLEVAIKELRKLIKGNKEGASFSNKTSNLNLPVVGGKVKKYKGNMAEVCGKEGAKVVSIYEGKVVEIKRNKINNKYDVFIAHGEYITSYANLSAVSVAKNSIVKRGQQIGTIGHSVDPATMNIEYKIVFGIYAPTPNITVQASTCFKKN